jgi:glycosyltransferase involved in cell wall biosynthesis
MRLLYVLPEYLPHTGGGITTFYRHLLPQLVAMGHEVRVVVGSGLSAVDDFAPMELDGVRVESLRGTLRDAYLPRFAHYSAAPGLQRYLAAAWALWEQAGRGEGYDVVETTDWGLLFAPWMAMQSCPSVVQLHGSCGQIDLHDPVMGEALQGHLIRMLERAGVALATEVQCTSPANAEAWRAQTSREIQVLPPAVALGAVRSSPRTDRGLVVGRVQRWKGPHVLCEALELLGARAPGIDWVGRDTSWLERGQTTAGELAQKFPQTWGSRVRSLPPMAPEQVASLQAAARFVVVPSTWDIFNFTCIEAMSMATPVICSTGAGAAGWIKHGDNGFVFEAGSARALADAMVQLLDTGAADLQRVGENGRATVASVMAPEIVAAQRTARYQSVAGAPNRALRNDDWVRFAVSPSDEGRAALRFLDHLPLRELAKYVGDRAVRTVRQRIRS